MQDVAALMESVAILKIKSATQKKREWLCDDQHAQYDDTINQQDNKSFLCNS